MSSVAILRDFLDSLEEGVLFLDAERRILDINRAAAATIGQDKARVIDLLCPTLFAGTRCAHLCDIRGHCSLTPAQHEGSKVQDVVLKGAHGRDIPVRMWAMLLPPNDEGLYCAIILRDRSREVELEEAVQNRWQLGDLVGRSPAMQDLYRQVLRAAASEANVLVTGESGVGKELVARALHDNAARSDGPYVTVHCAALPENLLESELFGHAKGAFSGATATRIGRFEAACGGTLLLDEIGEITPATQVKLLRVLQEREIVRIGENVPRKIDVRVVAATNRDLAAMVERGEFREDLYYRLRVLPLQVPPLRDRREDISLIATKLLGNLAERYRRPELRLSTDAVLAMEAYPWPGNVRQLFNALEYAVVQADGAVILPQHLLPEVLAGDVAPETSVRGPNADPTGPGLAPRGPGNPFRSDMHDYSRGLPARGQPLTRYYRTPASPAEELAMIQRVLEETGGNKAEAARRLGMSRTTLWKRLRGEG
ncbi:MAG TPA: sigma 54-interacting transcriptional regulator [Rhodocyclaceae bacterium]|nr:sigma 54-interacting transcriptional regulator [Rhodocyclaceae bacterium]